MLKKVLAFAAAASTAGAPCLAASVDAPPEQGERRSGAAVGMYLSVPFGGARSGRAQAGLRLRMSHDYRNPSAPAAPVIQADALDLRLMGDREPTLYAAGMPLNGEAARRNNLTGVGTLVSVAVLAAAVVGAVVIYKAVDDDDADDDQMCLIPEGCP